MDIFTQTDMEKLLSEKRRPCISIYMPTLRKTADQNKTRLKNLLADATIRLEMLGISKREIKELLAPAQNYFDDNTFWLHQSDGVCIFLAPNFMHLYRLPICFQEGAYVGMQFHITPLLPLTCENGKFFILAISQKAVRLLQGNRLSITELDLKGVPRNLAEALLTHDRDEPLTFHTRQTSGGTWCAIFEGHGVGIDNAKNDILLYFQKIDHGLHAILRNEHIPLILAAVDYLHPIYKECNSYPYLWHEGIHGSPDHMSLKELHGKAWHLISEYFSKERTAAWNLYQQLSGTGRTASQTEDILTACNQGHVETLFIPRQQNCWGQVASSGKVEVHEIRQPGDEDLINLATVETLGHGHKVYEMENDVFKPGENLGAIFNLPLTKHS